MWRITNDLQTQRRLTLSSNRQTELNLDLEAGMNQDTALILIDEHKNSLIDPVDILNWTWLRVIIKQIPSDKWDEYAAKATEVMSQ